MHADYKVANACCRWSKTVAKGGLCAVRLLGGRGGFRLAGNAKGVMMHSGVGGGVAG